VKLFHISEEENIVKFIPRIPNRDDLDKSKGLVWALSEQCLPNFLTPRDCPRVAYHATEQTTQEDVHEFFSSAAQYCVAIEYGWYKKMLETSLYVYEFNSSNFYLQDTCAGYYVSTQTEKPISKIKIDNLFEELFLRNVEVRIINNLWSLADRVKYSTLNWSLCRMRNAKPSE